MIVTRLKLANVRAVEAAEFSFKPGFNLIIGVNGVGKTTSLESLAVSLAAISRHLNGLKGPLHGFTGSDIRAGTDVLTVESEVSFTDKRYSYVIHQPREAAVAQPGKEGLPREQTVATPAKSAFVGDTPPAADGKKVLRPLAVLFSTRRAVPSDRAPTKSAAKGGHAAAFAEAFSARELRLGEFAAWMRAQGALAAETPASARVLDAFEKAVRRFLPGYANLRVSDEPTPRLLIERRGVEIPVRQLSDGERGSLALVLDLTRRLAQANPGLDDPAAKGPGVVLIDEIDLHLHPKWQREIVRNLPDAFPRLQFIATTHSPQVIGEVEPDRIHVMGRGPVFSPTHSFGVDSSRVLEEIMDAPPALARGAGVARQAVEERRRGEAGRGIHPGLRARGQAWRGRRRGHSRSHAPRFPRRRGVRAITKGQEPRSLVEHRANAHCDYANYADKDGLRAALVRDQRGLCCYCMTRVEATGTGMKIEHWRCQSRNADLELTYSNLLAACLGGHGQPEALQHCDTRKGEQDLKFNPANGAHRIEQRIRFESDGTIASGDVEFDAQLNEVLNLNLPLLKNRRKGVLTAILDWWKSEKARLRGAVPIEQLARERARRAGDGARHLTPFDPVAVWWLDQRLARSAT